MKKLSLGLPAGSLQEMTFDIFKKAGFQIITNGRSYIPTIDDDEIKCLLIRAQEIPKYVEEGVLDIGLTGQDWIEETKADVKEIAELVYGKKGLRPVRLVLAVPNNSNINTIKDLNGKNIATEYTNITKQYLLKKGVKANVEFSWGATEAKPPELADAIVELTETGNSLKANNLKILETIMESTTKVIVNKRSIQDKWKQEKINNLVMLLKGALIAEEMVGLKLNIHEKQLNDLVKILPALRKPSVSPLSQMGWLAVEVITEEKKVRELIPKLKALGAEGIVEYPLNKIIP